MPFDAMNPVQAPLPHTAPVTGTAEAESSERGLDRSLAYVFVAASGLLLGAFVGLIASLALGLISIAC